MSWSARIDTEAISYGVQFQYLFTSVGCFCPRIFVLNNASHALQKVTLLVTGTMQYPLDVDMF